MDFAFYLNEFRLATAEISQEKLDEDHLKISIDIVLESAALKIYKSHWYGDSKLSEEPSGRIFFSVWINEKTIEEGRIYYNIHALKLRELKNYNIASKDFAQNFRYEFSKHQKDWPNVNVNFGPLTLMQGWIEMKNDTIRKDVYLLAQKFMKISSIIDKVLEKFEKP
ncbi:uncharacterized protein CHSO_1403 [Chryseobacterium sp. StRB126]|uniref:hypothetical protein n=1 Tax=Chryseobacterium sp. StRB126 TaxID=878220 RepID=UPI0004E98A8B|nr:hypothetical protein [Chryseobacterium sp. StRB126]BAP30440.1 uncharacterized protein CHSO_1403 [Chryseobacterium sp. StRB126]